MTTELVSQESARALGVLDVCVLHIEPFFLLVDIQHTQCPCQFFLLEKYKLHTNAVSRVDNGMTCRRTGYDRYGIRMLAIQMGQRNTAYKWRQSRSDKETTEKIREQTK